jgi:hypothetical protein
VSIARARVHRPGVLLADESVASLDPDIAHGVRAVLASPHQSDPARGDRGCPGDAHRAPGAEGGSARPRLPRIGLVTDGDVGAAPPVAA